MEKLSKDMGGNRSWGLFTTAAVDQTNREGFNNCKKAFFVVVEVSVRFGCNFEQIVPKAVQ